METKTTPPQHNLLAEVPQRRLGKIIGILLGILLLVGAAAASYWYFFLGKQSEAPAFVSVTDKNDGSELVLDDGTPKLIFYGRGGLVSWQNGKFSKILTTDNALFGATLSPDRQSLIVGEYNSEADGSASGLFGSSINTLKIVSLDTSAEPVVIGEEKKTAKWDFRWSPDGAHVAYVVNDGASLEILNLKENKVVAKSVGKDTTPVQWFSADQFSFVQDGMLYSGTIKNPKEKVVAKNVDNSLCVFESPPLLVAPLWSRDGKYVGFYRTDGFYIKNLKDGKEVSIAPVFADEGPCGNAVDIISIGWAGDGNFYYSDSQRKSVSVFKIALGDFEKFSNSYAHPDALLVNISPDSRYMVFPPHDATFPYMRINEFGPEGKLVCNNEHLFTGSLAGEDDAAWSHQSPGMVVLKTAVTDGVVYSIFDVKKCSLMNTVLITKEGEFGSELTFLGIQ